MFKKKFIPQMCILFYNQLWSWDGIVGGLGKKGFIHHTADGKLIENLIYPLLKMFPCLPFLVTIMNTGQATFHN